MIEITYDFKNLDITVKGHANSAPMGEDLICGSVSTLAVTLGESLKDAKRQDMIEDLTLEFNEGDAHIKAVPKNGYERDVMIMFSTILNGFDALSHAFGEFVSFKPKVGIRENTN